MLLIFLHFSFVVAALRLLMEAKEIRKEYGWLHLNSALVQRYISDVYKRQ